jgi:hypothetical protein
MSVVFFLPLSCIALYESTIQKSRNGWMKSWLLNRDQGDSEEASNRSECRDPEVDGNDAEHGLEISKVKFTELIKVFPDTHQSSEGTILKEIGDLRGLVEALAKRIEQLTESVSKVQGES